MFSLRTPCLVAFRVLLLSALRRASDRAGALADVSAVQASKNFARSRSLARLNLQKTSKSPLKCVGTAVDRPHLSGRRHAVRSHSCAASCPFFSCRRVCPVSRARCFPALLRPRSEPLAGDVRLREFSAGKSFISYRRTPCSARGAKQVPRTRRHVLCVHFRSAPNTISRARAHLRG